MILRSLYPISWNRCEWIIEKHLQCLLRTMKSRWIQHVAYLATNFNRNQSHVQCICHWKHFWLHLCTDCKLHLSVPSRKQRCSSTFQCSFLVKCQHSRCETSVRKELLRRCVYQASARTSHQRHPLSWHRFQPFRPVNKFKYQHCLFYVCNKNNKVQKIIE